MARGVLVVYTNPVSPELETDFNDWYDQVHLPEVLSVAGFTSATRYRLADVQMPGSAAAAAAQRHRYLAIYEVDDLATAAEALRAAAPAMTAGPAMDVTDVRPVSLLFEALPAPD
jgi:hypothetical protein